MSPHNVVNHSSHKEATIHRSSNHTWSSPFPSNPSSIGTPPDSPQPSACQPSEPSLSESDVEDKEWQESEDSEDEYDYVEDEEDEEETWAAIEKKPLAAKKGKRVEAKKRNQWTEVFVR
jgi:cell division protein FtsN